CSSDLCEDLLTENLGIEYGFFRGLITLRSGISLYNLGAEGYQFSAGLSLNTRLLKKMFRVDYAFGINGIKTGAGVHHLALVFSL
ncbi:MAG: hypothetical protein PHF84_10765, partial [bacterium]|nr:hypothetical protein [bacterium]